MHNPAPSRLPVPSPTPPPTPPPAALSDLAPSDLASLLVSLRPFPLDLASLLLTYANLSPSSELTPLLSAAVLSLARLGVTATYLATDLLSPEEASAFWTTSPLSLDEDFRSFPPLRTTSALRLLADDPLPSSLLSADLTRAAEHHHTHMRSKADLALLLHPGS